MAARDLFGSYLVLAALVACGEEPSPEEQSDSNNPSLVRVDAWSPAEPDRGDAGASPEDDAAAGDGGSAVLPDASVVDAQAHDAESPSDGSAARVIPDASETSDASLGCKTKFYLDADRDGFGLATSFVFSCKAPDGYVADATDCLDTNASAKPGQTGRFNFHRGDGSYDYDCDGVEKPMSSKVASCPDLTTALCSPAFSSLPLGLGGALWCDYDAQVATWQIPLRGWYGKLPACGQPGLQNLSVVWSTVASAFTCVAPAATASRIQACN